MQLAPAIVLHIAQRASAVTALDRWVIVAGAAFIAFALGAIWLPAVLRRRAARGRLARLALVAFVALALSPSLLPLDHVIAGTAPSAESALHKEHCHGTPASCSDAPVSAGSGQFLTAQPLTVAPAMLMLLILLATPVLTGITRRPDLRPPLAAPLGLP
jgi:hypothetical protein